MANRFAAAAAVLALCVLSGVPAGAATTAGAQHDPTPGRTTLAHGRYAVDVADYTLGDSAFRTLGAYIGGDPSAGLAPIELTGRVYYPRTRTRTPRPLVILLHGYQATCADRSASLLGNQALALENAWRAAHPAPRPDSGSGRPPVGTPPPNPDQDKLDRIIGASFAKLFRWPCAKGTPALPSYLGYDYLARGLASHGMTAVSISANGINAVDLGSTNARAALINKHLALWAQLDRTGRGPLAGHFTRAGTATPIRPDFRHTIDLHRVGTLGHSRGGSAVFWHAADNHRAALPHGVRIAATVGLAPAGSGGSDEDDEFRVTRVPALIWEGLCDNATFDNGDDFIRLAGGRAHEPFFRVVVHGANHNFLNTQWSPSSGQVEANDDVDQPGVPRPVPGECHLEFSGAFDGQGNRSMPQLSETLKRETSRAYVTAFFLRELDGQRQWQPVLDGTRTPLGTRVGVDVDTFAGTH